METDMAKTKVRISVKEFCEDIRMGMDDFNLAEKYGLNQKLLKRVFERMVDAGYLTDEELYDRSFFTGTHAVIEFMDTTRAINELK
jgi:hypothetical protein